MANDYANGIAELMGTVPRISVLHAAQLYNRAWGRVRDARLWSFNFIADAQIFVPAAISTGTVTCTFNSATVTCDAAAAAAFNAVSLGPPPLAGVLGVGRQLRVGSSSGASFQNGPNYTILTWDGVSTLTIDKPYGETSVAGSAYQVLKAYYGAPSLPFSARPVPDQNFVYYTSIINRFDGYSFRGKNLNWSQDMLNAIDPQRGGQGQAYIQANYGRAADGTPVFELYPNPVEFTTYNACYVTRWPDVSPTQDLPRMPYDLAGCVLFQAKYYAAQWALANVGTFAELGQTNWVTAMNSYAADYKAELIGCIKNDDNLMPQQAYRQGSGFDFPLGGAFLQGHDVSSLIPS